MPTPDVPGDRDTPVELVRSEEELVVTTRAVESGRVRLRKRIVTETVTTTTEVRREELVVERLPAGADAPAAPGDPAPAPRSGLRDRWLAGRSRRSPTGAPFEDADVEIVLMEEHVEVSKRVVPRERVRLTKHIVTEHHDVTDAVRKEEVSLDEAPAAHPLPPHSTEDRS